jgi:hypothetical protein
MNTGITELRIAAIIATLLNTVKAKQTINEG